MEPNPFYWGGEPQIDSLTFRDLFGSVLDGSVEFDALRRFDVFQADADIVESVLDGNPGTLDGVSFGIFEPAIFEAAPQVSFLALVPSLRLTMLNSGGRCTTPRSVSVPKE